MQREIAKICTFNTHLYKRLRSRLANIAAIFLVLQNAKFTINVYKTIQLLGALGHVAIVSAVHYVLDRAAHLENHPLS